MIGKATSMGAVTILNAISSGRGATVAVRLPTKARVRITRTMGGWTTSINGRPTSSVLGRMTARETIRILGRDPEDFSGSLETETAAPMGVGLKTSSSSSVALALATLDAFGEDSRPADVLKCSVSSSLQSGVSLTGALDDASSCLLGGTNFVDNASGLIISTNKLRVSLPVLIKVPRGRSRRNTASRSYTSRFSELADWIFDLGRKGEVWKAMTLNGLLYSSIYGYDTSDEFAAIEHGALGAGLSGTGPAVAAVFEDIRAREDAAKAWAGGGAQLIRTETTDEGGRIGS